MDILDNNYSDMTISVIHAADALITAQIQNSPIKTVLLGILYTVISTLALFIVFHFFRWVFRKIIDKLKSWRGTKIRPFKIQNLELLSVNRVIDVIIQIIKAIGIFAELTIFYLYLAIVFSFFPYTAGFAELLSDYMFATFATITGAFISYLPNLFFIITVIVIAYYVAKLAKFIFLEIGRGTINIAGFYKEWAEPTSKIVRFFIFAMALVIILPYIPGWESEAFRGLSIFLGVIVSFGSSAAVSNIIAGIILTYTRAFKPGDRLKIDHTMGDVIEKTLLVTRLRTIKYEIISIPNAVVLSTPIINYSTDAPGPGLILHTSVTISYKVPNEKIIDLLISAANETKNIKSDPPSFVLMTKLNDSFITYEINAYTDKPTLMQNTYSELHRNIHNKFNEGGVEIMSPHYTAIRDGNTVQIPDKYVEEDYTPPVFRITPINK